MVVFCAWLHFTFSPIGQSSFSIFCTSKFIQFNCPFHNPLSIWRYICASTLHFALILSIGELALKKWRGLVFCRTSPIHIPYTLLILRRSPNFFIFHFRQCSPDFFWAYSGRNWLSIEFIKWQIKEDLFYLLAKLYLPKTFRSLFFIFPLAPIIISISSNIFSFHKIIHNCPPTPSAIWVVFYIFTHRRRRGLPSTLLLAPTSDPR